MKFGYFDKFKAKTAAEKRRYVISASAIAAFIAIMVLALIFARRPLVEFVKDPEPGFFSGAGACAETVRLPHSVAESPLHYADPADYSGTMGYVCEFGG